MIFSCLDGLTHSIQTARPQKITPDYAAPATGTSIPTSRFISRSA